MSWSYIWSTFSPACFFVHTNFSLDKGLFVDYNREDTNDCSNYGFQFGIPEWNMSVFQQFEDTELTGLSVDIAVLFVSFFHLKLFKWWLIRHIKYWPDDLFPLSIVVNVIDNDIMPAASSSPSIDAEVPELQCNLHFLGYCDGPHAFSVARVGLGIPGGRESTRCTREIAVGAFCTKWNVHQRENEWMKFFIWCLPISAQSNMFTAPGAPTS